jgi:hypothetical protein
MDQSKTTLARLASQVRAKLQPGTFDPTHKKQKHTPSHPVKTRWNSNIFQLPAQNRPDPYGSTISQYNFLDVQKIMDIAG